VAGIISVAACKGALNSNEAMPPKDTKSHAAGIARGCSEKDCFVLVKKGDFVHQDERDYIKVISVDDKGILLEARINLGFLPEDKPKRVRLYFDRTLNPIKGEYKDFRVQKTGKPGIVRLGLPDCCNKNI
jgi:hypothetical protein